MNSMNALCGEREREVDIAVAQEDVSSVVVLDHHILISISVSLYPIQFILSHLIPISSNVGDPTISQTPHL